MLFSYVIEVWADGKTKGFIEPKGSRRRVRVRVCRVFDSIEPEAQRARRGR